MKNTKLTTLFLTAHGAAVLLAGPSVPASPPVLLLPHFPPNRELTWAELADRLAAYAKHIGIDAPDHTVLIPASASAQGTPTRGEAAAAIHPQYAVFSSKDETQVAVTFRHAAFTPVFTNMTIRVNGGNGASDSRTYDITS